MANKFGITFGIERTRQGGSASIKTAAYLASDTKWRMAERALAGQDFGNGIIKVEFDMLAPGMTEPSITDALDVC